MALTTPTATEVKAIIATTLSDAAVDAFIADALLLVEDCPAVELVSTNKQKAIIKYLAAHLIVCSNPKLATVTQQSLGDASESYAAAPVGNDLRSTQYGSQALLLETSGCLEGLGKRKAFVEVL